MSPAPRWPASRLDIAPIQRRLKTLYLGEHRRGAIRDRLRWAMADVGSLLNELEVSRQSCDGFLEAIGCGVLSAKETPDARRRLRELAQRRREVRKGDGEGGSNG